MRNERCTGSRVLAGMAIGWGLVTPAFGATSEQDPGLLAIAILAAVVLFVVGLGLRVLRGARMSAGWKAFIDRRKAEGRSTEWADWDDDEDEDERRSDKRGVAPPG